MEDVDVRAVWCERTYHYHLALCYNVPECCRCGAVFPQLLKGPSILVFRFGGRQFYHQREQDGTIRCFNGSMDIPWEPLEE